MAKQTEKCRYESKYSPQVYITAAQYINELICEHKAAFDKTELTLQFWKHIQWKSFFMKNLRKIHKLLREYDERAIIKAIKSFAFSNCYSIFTDHFINLVEIEQSKIDLLDSVPIEKFEINRDTLNSKPREQIVKPNILTKLRDLDETN